VPVNSEHMFGIACNSSMPMFSGEHMLGNGEPGVPMSTAI
jgi:hypothetical protein